MTGMNPMDSLNMAYLNLPSTSPSMFPSMSSISSFMGSTGMSTGFSPADMGMGLFNMPVMPPVTPSMSFGSAGGIFNQNNTLLQSPSPFGNFEMPMSPMSPMSNFDWSAGLTQALEQQKIFMENMKKQMTLAFNMAMAKKGINTSDATHNPNSAKTNLNAGYGNNNFDVTKKYTGSASDLDKNLKGVLSGKGAKMIELQEKYGVNAAFLAALVNTESAHGNSNAARNKNNVAGIMSKESGYMKLASFSSVDACLESLAKNLSKNYVGKGLTTISQIHGKYCPVGAANDPTGMNKNWGSVIGQLTEKYEMA